MPGGWLGPHRWLRGPLWAVDVAARDKLNVLSRFKPNKRGEKKFGDTSEVHFIRCSKCVDLMG